MFAVGIMFSLLDLVLLLLLRLLLPIHQSVFKITLDKLLNNTFPCQYSCPFDLGSLSYLCIMYNLVLRTFLWRDKKQAQRFQKNKTKQLKIQVVSSYSSNSCGFLSQKCWTQVNNSFSVVYFLATHSVFTGPKVKRDAPLFLII